MRLEQLFPEIRSKLVELPPGTLWTLVVRVVAVGLEFVAVLLLARHFQATDYGSYSLVMSCIAIAVVPAMFGFDRLLVREVAGYRAAGDWPHLKGLLRRSTHVVTIGSILAAAIILVGGRRLLGDVSPDAADALSLGIFLIPIVAFVRIHQGILQGNSRLPAGLIPESVVQPGLLVAAAIVVALVPSLTRSAILLVGIQIGASCGALILAAILVRASPPRAARDVQPEYRDAAWFSAGWSFMLLVGMSAVLTNADTLLVGALVGPADAGIYRVSSQFAMFVALPLTAASLAIAPRISAAQSIGRLDGMRSEVTSAARLCFLAAIAIGILVAAAAPSILAFLGAGFPRGYAPALILVAAYWVHCAMATSGYLLIMSGHERFVMAAFAVGAALSVSAGVALIPPFGLSGAAIASGGSLVLVSVSCAWLCWRRLGINATIFAAGR